MASQMIPKPCGRHLQKCIYKSVLAIGSMPMTTCPPLERRRRNLYKLLSTELKLLCPKSGNYVLLILHWRSWMKSLHLWFASEHSQRTMTVLYPLFFSKTHWTRLLFIRPLLQKKYNIIIVLLILLKWLWLLLPLYKRLNVNSVANLDMLYGQVLCISECPERCQG